MLSPLYNALIEPKATHLLLSCMWAAIAQSSIPVAVRSTARVCGRSISVIAGSNPAGGMDVCVVFTDKIQTRTIKTNKYVWAFLWLRVRIPLGAWMFALYLQTKYKLGQSRQTNKYVWSTHTHTHSTRGYKKKVSIAIRYGLDSRRIESRWGRNFPHTSRPALGPTQPPIQWVSCLFPGGKSARWGGGGGWR